MTLFCYSVTLITIWVLISHLFTPSSTNNLRDHSKKVQKPRSNKLRVGFIFSQRVVNDRSVLSKQVSALSVNIFKEELGLHEKICMD